MLPKTTSTLCFPLLTLECKKAERAAKIRLWHVLTLKTHSFLLLSLSFLTVAATYWPIAVISCHSTYTLFHLPNFLLNLCFHSVSFLSPASHDHTTHTHTRIYIYRAVQPTFPVWWATSTTRNVVGESSLTMRSLCFCASAVEKPTAPRLAETIMCAPNTPRLLQPPWQPRPTTTRTISLTPTTTPAKRG